MGTHKPLMKAALSSRRFGLLDCRDTAAPGLGLSRRQTERSALRTVGPPPSASNGAFHVLDSAADRFPRPRKNGPNVGTLFDPFRNRTLWRESDIEEDVLHLLVASPDVADVAEQQTVRYRVGHAVLRYTFDALVTWHSGWRSGFEFKEVRQLTPELDAKLRQVMQGRLRSDFDDIRTLADTDFTALQVTNARLVVECGADLDREAIRAVRAALPADGTLVSLGELAELTGLGRRGYRAAVALLQAGDYAIGDDVTISPDAVAVVARRLA